LFEKSPRDETKFGGFGPTAITRLEKQDSAMEVLEANSGGLMPGEGCPALIGDAGLALLKL
jgi:hypothetical protein